MRNVRVRGNETIRDESSGEITYLEFRADNSDWAVVRDAMRNQENFYGVKKAHEENPTFETTFQYDGKNIDELAETAYRALTEEDGDKSRVAEKGEFGLGGY